MTDLLSFVDPDDVAGLIAIVMTMMIPIVAILARHQQKMAMIMRQPMGNSNDESVMRLAAEVHELRTLVTQQAIAMDSLAESNRRLSMSLERQTVSERISV